MTESRKRAVLGSESLDFGSIAAGGTLELTFAKSTHYSNARAGDAVVLGPPANLPAGLMATGYVNADDDIVVRLFNSTGAPIDPSAGGVKEVQDLVHDHTGGTFTISWNGEAESSALSFDDDGSGIAAYLEAFTYGGTAVTVTVVENATGDWTITFDTPVADLPEIVVETDSLTGGATIDLTETVVGVAAEDALWSFALVI
jgi:hypothetical protein